MSEHPIKSTKLLWASDLHLDRADDESLARFIDELAGIDYDIAVVTGDISSSDQLGRHLTMLARATRPRPLAFVLGNHDTSRTTFREVQEVVANVCQKEENLRHLDKGTILPLNRTTALVGNGACAEASAKVSNFPEKRKRGARSTASRQRRRREEGGQAMRDRDRKSADALRATLPLALTRYNHVIVATHVPPFPTAALFNGRRSSKPAQFADLSAGLVLIGFAKQFPDKLITTLAGHTHCRARQWILPSLQILVAAAQPGKPAFEDVIELAGY
ncbi:MAG: metallophosphoesterase [Akkermansiaceae bacterium]|nr:metallophosphoesterase [Akkermansiaceae bacterium]